MAAWLINARTEQMGSVKDLAERDTEQQQKQLMEEKEHNIKFPTITLQIKCLVQNRQLKKAGSTK